MYKSYNLFSPVMMITGLMNLVGNLPLGHDALLFSISGTGSFKCPVAQRRRDIPRPLITQSWTTGGKSKCSGTIKAGSNCRLVHSRTRQPSDHDDRPKSEKKLYPGSSPLMGGGGRLR